MAKSTGLSLAVDGTGAELDVLRHASFQASCKG